MPLYKHVREDVEKLTFIKRTEFKNGKYYMFYDSDGKIKSKSLPFRASQSQLLAALEFIKNDSDYFLIEAEKYARGDYNIKPKDMVVETGD